MLLITPASACAAGAGDDFVKEGLVQRSTDWDADADHGDGNFRRGPDDEAHGVAGVVFCREVGDFKRTLDAARTGTVWC